MAERGLWQTSRRLPQPRNIPGRASTTAGEPATLMSGRRGFSSRNGKRRQFDAARSLREHYQSLAFERNNAHNCILFINDTALFRT